MMAPMTDLADAPPKAPRAPRKPVPDWARRTFMGVVLLAAAAFFVYASSKAETGPPGTDPDPVIISQFPGPGAKALRQTEVGVDLKPGYDGRLTINGIAIPEDQMVGAVDPKTLSADQLRRYGIRPNNRNHVFFLPGEGKAIEKLPQGQVVVSVRYFRERRPDSGGRSVSWTFTVD
jgi:hypothetical protein